jgi:hypothetical protein
VPFEHVVLVLYVLRRSPETLTLSARFAYNFASDTSVNGEPLHPAVSTHDAECSYLEGDA